MKSKDLRKLIVDNAQEIFSRFGLKKTTVDDIAATINKAKSSIYYYFKSKEEIYEAVIEKEADMLRKEIHNEIDKYELPQDKIKAYIITRMKMFHKLANFYSTFQKEYIENYSFINRIRVKYDKEEIEIIKQILDYGIKKHNLKVNDIELTGFAILTAMKGFEYYWTVEKDIEHIEKDVNYLLDILFYGLLKR